MALVVSPRKATENHADGERPMHRSSSGTSVTFPKYEGEGGAVTVPEGTTRIALFFFAGCTNLTQITLPKTLKAIRGAAFFGCTG